MHMVVLVPETLHLSISIIDRFLSRKCVPRKTLQLLAVASLLIACKYEEVIPIEAYDVTHYIDFIHTRQEVLTMELLILNIIDYRLTIPTGYMFLQQFLHITKATSIASNLASFYMERMLLEYSTLDIRPSHLAAAAVSLAVNNPDLPENKLTNGSEYTTIPKISGVVCTTKLAVSPLHYSYILTTCFPFLAPTIAGIYRVFVEANHDSLSFHRNYSWRL